MTSKDIKLLAGNIVLESEYSDSAKKQLLNFIANEATDHQIKTLILDGNIELIEDDAKNIIDKRFDIVTENAVLEVIEDTITFLSIGRDTICEFFESQGYEGDQLKEMKNFIMNEASDYQIISILVDNILPNEDSNPVAEAMLFECFNLNNNTNFVALSEYGISSILNEQGGRLGGIYKKIDSTMDELKRWTGKTVKGPKAAEHVKDLKDELNYLKGEAGKIRGAAAKKASAAGRAALSPGAAASAAGRAALSPAAAAAKKASAAGRAALSPGAAASAAGRAALSPAAAAAKKASAAHAAGPITPAAMASKIPSKMPERIGAADAAKNLYKTGSEYVGKAIKHGTGLAKQVGGNIASAAAAHPVAAGLGAAALAGYAAHKLYKRYRSKKEIDNLRKH